VPHVMFGPAHTPEPSSRACRPRPRLTVAAHRPHTVRASLLLQLDRNDRAEITAVISGDSLPSTLSEILGTPPLNAVAPSLCPQHLQRHPRPNPSLVSPRRR
jgi:hypothetical protein